MGAPFSVPAGVTVATNGDVYVANPGSDAAGSGNILKVTAGVATEFVPGINFGYPAGLALDVANLTLFVSGHDATGHDQVYAVTLSNKTVATFNTGISQNTAGGGLHRARTADIYSWADFTARPMGGFIIR